MTLAYENKPDPRKDLFQEILIAIWQALPRFRGTSNIKTYIYRIAHNRGITHQSTTKRERLTLSRFEFEKPELPDKDINPEQKIILSEQMMELHKAIKTLTPKLKQVMVMHLEGIPNKSIAEILGLKENTVAARIKRGKRQISITLS